MTAAAWRGPELERLHHGELNHRIGNLDLAPGAGLRRQQIEDFRLQDRAAGDDQVRRAFKR
jgi:hypothetical protein